MSGDKKPGLTERLSSAIRSTDLSTDADKRKDVDYLVALGLAQRGRPASALRLHLSGSQAGYRAACEGSVRIAAKLAAAKGWRMSEKNVRRVAELALAHHVFPACPHCKGVKFEVPEGSPYPTSKICQPCNGTGERPIQHRFNRAIRDVMRELERADHETAAAVGGYLR